MGMNAKCTEDEFVQLGFEVGGALGAKAELFMAECVRVAEWKNQGVGDLAFLARGTVVAWSCAVVDTRYGV